MKLIAENVTKIFLASIYGNEKSNEQPIIVQGVKTKVALKPSKIEQHKEDIISMVDQLPDAFKEDKGGGMPFLELCHDNDGNQWTGLHVIMDQLVVLGQAVDKISFLVERKYWLGISGAMQYLVIKK